MSYFYLHVRGSRAEAGDSLFAARVFEMMDDDKSGALVSVRPRLSGVRSLCVL